MKQVSMPTHPGPKNEIIGIQFLRYIAALAVLFDHLIIALCEKGRLPEEILPHAYKLGGMGVCLFFGISGFVMVLSNKDKSNLRWGALDFFARRFIRIWPMYCLATIIVFAAKYGADPFATFENLLKSLGFIPYVGPNDLYRPILGKGYTLNYEMFFYAIFGACLMLPKKAGLIMAAAALLVLGLNDGTGGGQLWAFYADKIVLYFLVGVVLGYLVFETNITWPHTRSAGLAITLAVLVAGAGYALNIATPPGGHKDIMLLLVTFASLFCVCFANSRFKSEKVRSLASLLGDSSYCLYLFHGFAFVALGPILKNSSDAMLFVLMPALTILITAGCVVIHLFVEKPVNRLFMRVYKNICAGMSRAAVRGKSASSL